jgi:hypothetical protein
MDAAGAIEPPSAPLPAAAQLAARSAPPRNLPSRCAWCPQLLGCRVPAPFAGSPIDRANRPLAL